MRAVGLSGVRKAARGKASKNVQGNIRSGNVKFQAGADPLELESMMTRIEPTSKQELEQMTKLLQATHGGPNASDEQRQALELWKFQVEQGTVSDQVKFQFLRRFYFWLLGRGEKEDTDKTSWGRANAAAHNPEVAAYIDQFLDKRTQYAMKLNMLSMRQPTTLNGYYLYFKYIVNGGLKRQKRTDGTSFWDMSDEDYLQDFDLFQRVLDKPSIIGGKQKGEIGYSDIIAPIALREELDPRAKPYEDVNPYPMTRQNLARNDPDGRHVGALQSKEAEANIVVGMEDSLLLNSNRKPAKPGKEQPQKPTQSDTGIARARPDHVSPGEILGNIDDSEAFDDEEPATPAQPIFSPVAAVAAQADAEDTGASDSSISEEAVTPASELKKEVKESQEAYEATRQQRRTAEEEEVQRAARMQKVRDMELEALARRDAKESKTPKRNIDHVTTRAKPVASPVVYGGPPMEGGNNNNLPEDNPPAIAVAKSPVEVVERVNDAAIARMNIDVSGTDAVIADLERERQEITLNETIDTSNMSVGEMEHHLEVLEEIKAIEEATEFVRRSQEERRERLRRLESFREQVNQARDAHTADLERKLAAEQEEGETKRLEALKWEVRETAAKHVTFAVDKFMTAEQVAAETERVRARAAKGDAEAVANYQEWNERRKRLADAAAKRKAREAAKKK